MQSPPGNFSGRMRFVRRSAAWPRTAFAECSPRSVLRHTRNGSRTVVSVSATDSDLRGALEPPITFTLMVHHVVLYKLKPEVTPELLSSAPMGECWRFGAPAEMAMDSSMTLLLSRLIPRPIKSTSPIRVTNEYRYLTRMGNF
jgi:hypothetical protein